MRLQDAKAILKEAKIRVCRHHPRLVLTPTELSVYELVQQGINNPIDLATASEKKIDQVRNLLTKLVKQGYLSRERQNLKHGVSQYFYSIVKWVPNAEDK